MEKSKSSESVGLTTKGKGKTSNEEGEKSEDKIKLAVSSKRAVTFMKGNTIVVMFEKGKEEEDNEGGEEGGCSGGKDDDDDDDNAGFQCPNCGKKFDDFTKLQRHKLNCLNWEKV